MAFSELLVMRTADSAVTRGPFMLGARVRETCNISLVIIDRRMADGDSADASTVHAYLVPCHGAGARVPVSPRWSWTDIRRYIALPELWDILRPPKPNSDPGRAVGVYASKNAQPWNAAATRMLGTKIAGDVLLVKTMDENDRPTAVLDITQDESYLLNDFSKDAWIGFLCRKPSENAPAIAQSFRCRLCNKPYLPFAHWSDVCACDRSVTWTAYTDPTAPSHVSSFRLFI